MGRLISHLFREFGSHCNEVAKAWNKFWFTPRDPYALCVIRCLVGWMAFYTILVWGIELEAFFAPQSYNSAAMIQDHFTNVEGPYALSFWTWVPTEWMYQVHYLSLGIAFCFMIGLFTRVTSVLTLIVLISYAYRARFANYGLDQIVTILTLYLCIGNSGEYLSVDRLIKRYRIAKGKIYAGLGLWKISRGPTATVATNIATRMMQFHYCVIYMAAGLGKLFGETWWDGTAMWRGLAISEYQTFDMTWMAYYPWATDFITHLTIAWEVAFAFLVWRPLTKNWMLLLGAGMHLGIGLMLGMWTFATCMIFGYLSFYEPEKVHAFLRYFRDLIFNSEQKMVEVVTSSAHSMNTAALKKTFDVTDRLVLVVDGSPPDFDQEQAGSIHADSVLPAISRLIMLDHDTKLFQKFDQAIQKTRIPFSCVSSLNQLQDAIEQSPDSIIIANLENFSDQEVQDYLGSILPLALKFYPSVTLLRSSQAHWLDKISTEDYQRILIQPCDGKDVLAELQRALHFYNDQFPDVNRQVPRSFFAQQQAPRETVPEPTSFQGPIDTVFE